MAVRRESGAGTKNRPEGRLQNLFLFMTILAQTFFALVGGDFMSLSLSSAGHNIPTLGFDLQIHH
jgi:hypothetical protein